MKKTCRIKTNWNFDLEIVFFSKFNFFPRWKYQTLKNFVEIQFFSESYIFSQKTNIFEKSDATVKKNFYTGFLIFYDLIKGMVVSTFSAVGSS